MTRLMVVMACLVIAGCGPSEERVREYWTKVEQDGREAGLAGAPPEACPFDSRLPYQHAAWKRGWMDGFKSRTKATRP